MTGLTGKKIHSIPKKKIKPFACGKMNFYHMTIIFGLLLGFGFVALNFINGLAKIVLLIYLFTTILYTSFLKSIALVDISIISFGFVLRLYSGSISTNLDVSVELLIITFLLCLFLPLSKRRDDLIIGLNQRHRESLNYYSKDLIDNLLIFCLASFFSVLIFWSVSKDTIIWYKWFASSITIYINCHFQIHAIYICF